VVVDYQSSARHTLLDGSIQNVQVDNQLHEAQSPTVLYLSPSSKNDEHRHLPAIHFTANRMASRTDNADIFKHLIVTIKNMTLVLEEELLVKMMRFGGVVKEKTFGAKDEAAVDESAYEAQKALIASTSSAKR